MKNIVIILISTTILFTCSCAQRNYTQTTPKGDVYYSDNNPGTAVTPPPPANNNGGGYYNNNGNNTNVQDAPLSFQVFYDQLAPYGQWVGDPVYGNVFVPNALAGFRPYATDGHWVMTDNGNVWLSNEPWDWACYHYGRWTYNSFYGWLWIPGYEWAPAWVNWRTGGGYYGWVPMGPNQVYGGVYEYPTNYWVFVSPNYLYHPYVYNYYQRGDMGVYYQQTTYVVYQNNGSNYYGPSREYIERDTHQPVTVYRVSNSNTAGPAHFGGNELVMYRPVIDKASVNTARPANVIEAKDHPIGKPEPIAANHATEVPAFRQAQIQHPAQLPVQNNQPQQMQPVAHPYIENNSQPRQAQPAEHTPTQNNGQQPQRTNTNQPQQHPTNGQAQRKTQQKQTQRKPQTKPAPKQEHN